MVTDALQLLKDSHQRVSGLFEMIRSSPDLNEKLTLFQQVKDELEVLALIEEKVLYPAVSSFNEVSEMIDRSYDQHDDMSDLIEEIDQMELEQVEAGTFDSTIDDFDDSVEELREVFLQHMDSEEKELFPMIFELLEPEDLMSLANQMNELRGMGMAA